MEYFISEHISFSSLYKIFSSFSFRERMIGLSLFNSIYSLKQIGGIDQFEEYLKKIDRQHMIVLVDDFAVSSAFHKVEELLDAYGMKYEMESDE